jgi:hypothetical protein
MTKPGSLNCVGHVTNMRLSKNLERKKNIFEDLGMNRRLLLKLSLSWVGGWECGLDSCGSE